MPLNNYINKVINLLITRGAGVFLSFIVSIYLARYFGAETTGKYYLFISILMGLSIVSKLGFNGSLIKYCAQYTLPNEKEHIRGYWYSALKISLTACILIITISFSTNYLFPLKDYFQFNENILIYTFLSLIPFTLVGHNVAVLVGLNKQNNAAITDKVAPPLIFLCISAALYILIPNQENILLIYTASITIVFVISTIALWKTLHSNNSTISADSKKLIKTSKPILAINLTNFFTDWSATFILAIYGTLQQIGIYNISWRLITIMGILLLIFNNINAPKYSMDFKNNNLNNIDITARQTSTILFWLGLPIIILIILFADNIMLIFGTEFIAGAPILQILAVGQLFNFSTGSVGYLLLMTGHEKHLKNITIFICITQIIAMIVFIPKYGIYAAAIITSISITMKSIITAYIAYKKLGILSLPIPRKREIL